MSFECKDHHQAITINIKSPVSTPALHTLPPTCAQLPNCCLLGLWGYEHASARQKGCQNNTSPFCHASQTPVGLWPAKNCCCWWSEAFLTSHFWESLQTALAFPGGVGGDVPCSPKIAPWLHCAERQQGDLMRLDSKVAGIISQELKKENVTLEGK